VLSFKVTHSRDDFLCPRKKSLPGVFLIPHLTFINSSFPLWPVFICVHLWLLWLRLAALRLCLKICLRI